MKHLRTMGTVAAVLLFLILTACGGNNNNDTGGGIRGSNTPTLTLLPTTADIILGNSRTFTVTATNTDFTVTGNGCTKNNSTTVVCTPTSEGTHELTVTAMADTSLRRTATMTVTRVDIALATATGETEAAVMVGDAVTFVVTTTNTDFTMTPSDKAGCVRTGDEITCTPTEYGDYNLVVTATADTTKAAMVIIKAYEVGIAIDQSQATLTLGESKTFKVTTAHTGFDMDVAPVAGCIITDDEITCTPSVAGTYELTVTATADPSKTATVTITVVSDGPEKIEGMVFVEAGTFMMGCIQGVDGTYPQFTNGCSSYARPQHEVTLTKNFYIAQTEVTQQQWKSVLDKIDGGDEILEAVLATQSFPDDTDTPNRPVTNVSWNDAQHFISKLNEQMGRLYRLPTEAEWEYAAQGGKKNQTYAFSGSDDIDVVAWYDNNSNLMTHPVASKAPNELGLYDMTGNVSEWVYDIYSANYNSAESEDPVGPDSDFMNRRMVRGSNWTSTLVSSVITGRGNNLPTNRIGDTGFRLAMTAPEP